MLGPHYHLKSTNVAIDTVVIRSKTKQPKDSILSYGTLLVL